MLYGAVRNNVIAVSDAAEPTHRVVEIHSAGTVDEIRPTGRMVRSEVVATEVTGGRGVYSLDAGIFHTSEVTGQAATLAFGSGRPGTIDLSLGDLDTSTHRVQRRRCDSTETARIARAVLDRLAVA